MKRFATPRPWARYLAGLALGLLCVGVMKIAGAAAMPQGPHIPSMQHVLQAEVAAMGRADDMTAGDFRGMPVTEDCMPHAGGAGCEFCLCCYIEPRPPKLPTSGDHEAILSGHVQVHASAEPKPLALHFARGWYARLPVRIAFCRWLN